jgi:hypothetical protein
MAEEVRVTVEWVRAKVAEIANGDYDPEGMHSDEDELHEIVLRAIAGGTCADPAACAAAALETYKLDFPRWCA